MNPVDIIVKKRDGGELTRQELDFFIHGVTGGAIPDYQTAAWLMAVYFRGITDQETTHPPPAMAAATGRRRAREKIMAVIAGSVVQGKGRRGSRDRRLT